MGDLNQYFNRLSFAGFFSFLEQGLNCGNEAEAVFYDSTHNKVHQNANGPRRAVYQSIRKSRGELNTKVHMAIDAMGRLASGIILTPGNISDHPVAPKLTADSRHTAGVRDMQHNSKKLRDLHGRHGCGPCIHARSNVQNPASDDEALYWTPNCIENKHQRLNVFRPVANRHEKTQRLFFIFLIVAQTAI